MGRMHFAVAVFVLAAFVDVGRAEEIFELGRRRPSEVIVTIDEAPPRVTDGPAMAMRLQGVLAVWRGRDMGRVLASVPRETRPIGMPPDYKEVCVLHLRYGRSDWKRVGIVRTSDGTVVAHEIDEGDDGEFGIVELDRVLAGAFLMTLDQFRGSYDSVEDPIGETFRVEGEATPGWVIFDQQVLDERVNSPSIRFAPTVRYLEEEGFHVRLPKGYDPRRPAGLVIWISPTPDGTPPQAFAKALDELYLICVGADNSENGREPTERFQLAFDGMATVMRRYHVDPRRIYTTGFSGGGRMASMMHGAFADVVSGSVPIGGANAYKHVPQGTGRYWPAGYAKPDGAIFNLFRRQRMACVTGDKDFNYENVQGVVRTLKRDGVGAEVFDIEGLSHEIPDEDGFLEAISWVDERYRKERAEEVEEARESMETLRQRFGEVEEVGEGERRLLLMVMRDGAWTEAAWEAAEMLGLAELRSSGEKPD